MKKVEPKTLAGFMELLPKEQILFNKLKQRIQESYERFGFVPLDTPVIESSEVLLAKAGGETEKQIYSFTKGDSNLCLRFDLTVPLAKFVSANQDNLNFPFRRYQIGKVYRGERPQKGRFREFYQCDIDIVGRENLSIINDAEIPSIIYHTIKSLEIGDFVIKINNRKILKGFFEYLELENLTTEILRIIDKYEKIGKENFVLTLEKDLNLSSEKINLILDFITTSGNSKQKIEKLKSLNIQNQTYKIGVEELEQVVNYMLAFNLPENAFEIDLTIARGLDYYTGTVYETFLIGYEKIGSICSGGRYENLAEFYTDKKFPGVGISIGLTRLFDQLRENKILEAKSKTTTKVLIIPMTEDFSPSLKLASFLRENHINTEVYLENTKFKNKLSYANKQEIPYVVIIGEDEINQNYYTLKDMANSTQFKLSKQELLEVLNK